MNSHQLQAILAGVLFGVYPLLLNRSNLTGNVMGCLFSLIVGLCILPFAFSQLKTINTANWQMLLGASVVSAIAMMCMANFLATSEKTKIGLLILMMIITQATITALYQLWIDGISITKVFGFGFAIIAIILLNKK